MNWFLMIIVVLVSAALQVMIPAVVTLGHAKCPILLSVVLYYALHQDSTEMFVAAFLAGLVQDLLSIPPPGYSCLVCNWPYCKPLP
jgi:rod shape-determining protein MreD